MGRELLYICSAYPVDIVRKRKQDQFFIARERNGYFEHVWSFHPLVGLLGNRRAGRFRHVEYSPRQTIVDGFEQGPIIRKWLMPLNVLYAQVRLIFAMIKVIRRPNVQAVYASDSFYLGLLGLILKKLTGKPLLVGIYSDQDEVYAESGALAYPRLLPSRRLEKMVQRLVLRSADMVEVASVKSVAYAEHNGAIPDNIVLLPVVKFISPIHFIKPDDRESPSSFLAQNGVPLGRRYLIYVGRLLSTKHSDEALLAMETAIRGEPSAIGLLAGEGPLRPKLETMIMERGLQGRIFLLGDLDHATLATLMPHCITLSPLTGMALIETSLAGSVPVGYDRDWQAEFIHDGINGFVVPFRDYHRMAERAVELLRNPEMRRRMSEQMRRDAIAYTDIETYYIRERATLDAILGDGRQGSPDREHSRLR